MVGFVEQAHGHIPLRGVPDRGGHAPLRQSTLSIAGPGVDDTAEDFVVGRQGRAELTIEGGGKVDVQENMRVARQIGSVGDVVVSGLVVDEIAGKTAASTLEVGGKLFVAHEPGDGLAPAAGGDGSLTILNGAKVVVENETIVGAPLADRATLSIEGGTLETQGLDVNSTFTFAGGTLHLAGGVLRGFRGSDFEVDDELGETLRLSQGAIFDVEDDNAGDTLLVGDSETGTFEMRGGALAAVRHLRAARFGGDATIDLAGDGTQLFVSGDVQAGFSRTDVGLNGGEPIRLPGGEATISVTAGARLEVGRDMELGEDASLDLADGTVLARLVDTYGDVTGTGTIRAADFRPRGLLAPGASTGALAIDGDMTQGPDSILSLEIAGLGEGPIDELTVLGDATLAGTLELIFRDVFAPAQGDVIPLVDVAGQGVDSFDTVSLVNLKPGFEYETGFNADGLFELTALNDAEYIPEPTTMGLLALAGLLTIRRRRSG